MHLVYPHAAGRAYTIYRKLSAQETLALKQERYSVEKGSILLEAKTQRLWIACDCIDQGLQPLFTVRLDSDGPVLVRMTASGRIDHHNDCQWHRAKKASPVQLFSTYRYRYRQGDIALDAHLSDWEPTSDTNTNGQRGSGIPGLAQILFRVIESAGINTVKPQYLLPMTQQYQAIKQAAKSIPVNAESGILLSDVLCTHMPSLPGLYRKLRQSAPRWPDAIPPQGFALLVVDEIAGEYLIHPKYRPVKVAGPVVTPSRPGTRARAPYIVLAWIKETRPGHYDLVRAYAHPVVSKSVLVPVDSDFERQVLQELTGILSDWDPDFTIHKPLFDINGTRPDFVLMKGQRPWRIIECNTYRHAGYLRRKHRTQARMADIAPVIQVDSLDQLKVQRLKDIVDECK